MRSLSDFVSFVLVLLLLALMFGCSGTVQRVCPTGETAELTEQAVEFWASQGKPVMIADDSECTIRVRLAATRRDGSEFWENETDGQHAEHWFPTDLEPSHTLQSEIRFRTDYWHRVSKAKRLFVLTHELGHVWDRGHTDTGVMQANIPDSDTELSHLLTASP